ncbi:MAG TPA: DUF6411 family protein [Thermoleophilaceae bacterium]|nr:DUF6411 family protein [Thermoleophilaceae bacterium]
MAKQKQIKMQMQVGALAAIPQLESRTDEQLVSESRHRVAAKAILGFLVPRLSTGPQRGVDRTLGAGQRTGGKAPGILGRFFSKSFGTSRKATNKCAATGRKGRRKMPF